MIKVGEQISNATVTRLPVYLRHLQLKKQAGLEYISSVTIAEELKLNSVQVKKDLALVSSTGGKPKLGFLISRLIADIESFLGCDDSQSAIIVGVGKLGSALLAHRGFDKYGLKIVAGFDVNPEIVNKSVYGVDIYNFSEMTDFIKANGVKMAILSVKKDVAQEVVDSLVSAGILAIMNFAPITIKLPQNVLIQNMDIAASLAILSTKLKAVLGDK
jgi:redox-sensing transcriptional repressor